MEIGQFGNPVMAHVAVCCEGQGGDGLRRWAHLGETGVKGGARESWVRNKNGLNTRFMFMF